MTILCDLSMALTEFDDEIEALPLVEVGFLELISWDESLVEISLFHYYVPP